MPQLADIQERLDIIIFSSKRLRIGRVIALGNDQAREFVRQINIGRLQ